MVDARHFTKKLEYLPKGFSSSDELSLAARRCKKIINTRTGLEWPQPEPYTPQAKWEELYKQAKFDTDTFVCEDQEAPHDTIHVSHEYGECDTPVYMLKELESLNISELRRIGNLYEVKDVSKSGIISKILKKQDALLSRARAESPKVSLESTERQI
jgi:hypothetical protein